MLFQNDKLVYTMTRPESNLQLVLQSLCWFLDGVALAKKIEHQVMAQFHFGITALTQVALPLLQPEAVKTIKETYLDTPEHDLLKQKLWLKKRVSTDAQVSYSLRFEEQCESVSMNLYREITNLDDIITLITQKTSLVANASKDSEGNRGCCSSIGEKHAAFYL